MRWIALVEQAGAGPPLATVGVAALMAMAGCGSNSPTATQSANQFVSHALTEQVAFARCMRGHGVPRVRGADSKALRPRSRRQPGRIGGGGASTRFQFRPTGLPAPTTAGKPGAGQPAGEPQAAHGDGDILAACVRAHGVPNMPDPAANGVFNLPSEFNQNARAFQTAVKTCIPNGMPLSLKES